MMQFPQVGGTPKMPKKPKKTGIGGAIGDAIEKLRAKGRPNVGDMVPGAPRSNPKRETIDVEDEDGGAPKLKSAFTRGQRDEARRRGAARPPVKSSKYRFGRGGGT